ncbi:hypothetical protein [Pyrodictium abyssi]|uniref:hypothetical protein n=1 Tax=Pyrodictium abyssi TaxID=54256 RepID=UPI0030C6E490
MPGLCEGGRTGQHRLGDGCHSCAQHIAAEYSLRRLHRGHAGEIGEHQRSRNPNHHGQPRPGQEPPPFLCLPLRGDAADEQRWEQQRGRGQGRAYPREVRGDHRLPENHYTQPHRPQPLLVLGDPRPTLPTGDMPTSPVKSFAASAQAAARGYVGHILLEH